MSFDTIPKDLRGLRACLVCSLVKVFIRTLCVCLCSKHNFYCITSINFVCFFLFFQSIDQFEMDGCDNCEEFLRIKNNKDNVYDCTSNNFDGLIAVMSPEDSWVCKWQRISKLKLLNSFQFY